MDLNIEKLEYIYGRDIIEEIKNNLDEIYENIKYSYLVNISDPIELFERNVHVFLEDFNTFKIKIDKLIKKLGSNYIEEIENNVSILEEFND